MNRRAGKHSAGFRQVAFGRHETKPPAGRYWRKENTTMIIIMLASAMTLAMLIATAFGLHQEAEKVRFDDRAQDPRRNVFH